jgi:hypothetical protein
VVGTDIRTIWKFPMSSLFLKDVESRQPRLYVWELPEQVTVPYHFRETGLKIITDAKLHER